MADAAAEESRKGFARLTAFLRQDNSKEAQDRRTSMKMMQRGDTQITMWVRRTAVGVERLGEMMKSFLSDAAERNQMMMEMMAEAARAGGGGMAGGAGSQSTGGDTDWKSALKKAGGWKTILAAMLFGIGAWLKDLFSSNKWAEELGLEKASTMIGRLFGGGQKGNWLNAFVNAGKWAFMGAGIGLGVGGPVGMIAGALLGGAFGGIMGLIGAEDIAKTVDFIFKSLKRTFGLSTATTEKQVEEAKVEYDTAKKNYEDARKKQIAIQKQLAEFKGTDEEKLKLLTEQIKINKEVTETENKLKDARVNSATLQRDLLKNAENKLKDERDELKREMRLASTRKKNLKYRIETTYKNNESKKAEAQAEIDELNLRDKQREERLNQLKGPIEEAEKKRKQFDRAMKEQDLRSTPQIISNSVESTFEAIADSFGNIASLWRGKSKEAIAKDIVAWKKQSAAMDKHRQAFDRLVDEKEEKLNAAVERKLDRMEEAAGDDTFDRDEARKKILEASTKSRKADVSDELKPYFDESSRMRIRSLNQAEKTRDTALGEGKAVEDKWKGMLAQYNKKLEGEGKDEITMEKFKKLMDAAVAKFTKDNAAATITLGSTANNAKANAAEEGSGIPATINVIAPSNQVNAVNGGGSNGNAGATPPPVGLPPGAKARPHQALRQGGAQPAGAQYPW